MRRSPRRPARPLVALLPVLVLLLGLLAGAGTAAAAPAGPRAAGTGAYTGELTAEQLAVLVSTGIDRHEVRSEPGDAPGSVRVDVVLPRRTAAALVAAGLPLEERSSAADARIAAAGVFRPWSGSDGLRAEFTRLARQRPDIVKQIVIGRSVRGQEILAFKVTANARTVADGARPATLYVSAQHAREWITPEMNRRLFRHLLDNSSSSSIRSLLATTELWFVPVANPDGYDYTFTTDRLWRKNLRDSDGDGQISFADGVDPNRNFPTRWGFDNEGSSPSPDSETYRGPAPASEPETRALDGLMRRVDPEFLVNYHSAAELLLYGVGWQVATPTPDDVIYEAMVGDDANPAVPGYDPDISAELYTTNGDTTDHAHEAYGILSFTPEMATCQTASDRDPDDGFDAGDCESVFNFPDSEELVEEEFRLNLPFALAVARSATTPSRPVSVVGRSTPDFVVDSFDVSYGTPQTVAVVARRELRNLQLRYRIDGGPEQRAPLAEWSGGERYGDENDVYYAEFRGQVAGAYVGQDVQVWFTGTRKDGRRTTSESFTYELVRDGGEVLVLADEDYRGYNPGGPTGRTSPRYAQQYVDALAARGTSSAVYDVTARGVPHDLGVLSHFDTVVWYLGDNRLTQDREDVETDFFGDPLPDASVAERAQYLTLSVRDHLNAGRSLVHTGETTAYYGLLGTGLGGIYYGLDGAPEEDCAVTGDPFADCLLLADDFAQYWLGAYSRAPRSAPTSFEGTGPPVAGRTVPLAATSTNPLDEAGTFIPTSTVLPPDEFPQFSSAIAGRYRGGAPGNLEVFEGDWYAAAAHADNSYMRLTRTVDLRGVAAGQRPTLAFALSHDMEFGYDNLIVEARTAGGSDWRTLPEDGGATDTDVPDECGAGFYLDTHPQLDRYLEIDGGTCRPESPGSWNRITGTSDGWRDLAFDLSDFAGGRVEVSISYVTDVFIGGAGVFVDRTRLVVGGTATQEQGFETGLSPWTVPGSPAGSPRNTGDFERSRALAGAAVTTDDTVLLGFGIEQVRGAANRAALLGDIVAGLRG